jgi:hypothetical protein
MQSPRPLRLREQPDHFLYAMTRIQEKGYSMVVNHAHSDWAIVRLVEAYELEIAMIYGTQYQLQYTVAIAPHFIQRHSFHCNIYKLLQHHSSK